MTELKKAIAGADPISLSFLLESKENRDLLSKRDFLNVLTSSLNPELPSCLTVFLLKTIDNQFPETRLNQDYFFPEGALRKGGVEMILKSLEAKNQENTPYEILEDRSVLSSKIHKAYKEGKTRTGFLTSHTPGDKHWTLAYFSHEEKECSVIILDASNDERGTDLLFDLIVEPGTVPAGCQIYFYQEARQTDHITCAIYAIEDFLALNKINPIPKGIKKIPFVGIPDKDKHLFCNFPNGIQFLTHDIKMTEQSLKEVKQYVEGLKEHQEKNEAVGKLNEVTVTLSQKSPHYLQSQVEALSKLAPDQFPIAEVTSDLTMTNPLVKKYGDFCYKDPDTKAYFNTEKSNDINSAVRVKYNQYVQEIANNLLNPSESPPDEKSPSH